MYCFIGPREDALPSVATLPLSFRERKHRDSVVSNSDGNPFSRRKQSTSMCCRECVITVCDLCGTDKVRSAQTEIKLTVEQRKRVAKLAEAHKIISCCGDM